MALTLTALTSGNSAGTGNITTASISPASNSLIICAVSTGSPSGNQPSGVSGNGLTWVLINGTTLPGPKGSSRGIYVYRALGASPTSGAVTVTLSGATNNNGYSIFEVSGVITTGTNGSGAIIQNTANFASAVTSLTLTLSSLAQSSNMTVGCFADSAVALVAGGSFTQIHNNSSTPSIMTEYAAPGVVAVNCTASSTGLGGVAFEVGAPSGGVTTNGSFLMNFM